MTSESYKDIFEAAKTGTVEDVKYYIETLGSRCQLYQDVLLTEMRP